MLLHWIQHILRVESSVRQDLAVPRLGFNDARCSGRSAARRLEGPRAHALGNSGFWSMTEVRFCPLHLARSACGQADSGTVASEERRWDSGKSAPISSFRNVMRNVREELRLHGNLHQCATFLRPIQFQLETIPARQHQSLKSTQFVRFLSIWWTRLLMLPMCRLPPLYSPESPIAPVTPPTLISGKAPFLLLKPVLLPPPQLLIPLLLPAPSTRHSCLRLIQHLPSPSWTAASSAQTSSAPVTATASRTMLIVLLRPIIFLSSCCICFSSRSVPSNLCPYPHLLPSCSCCSPVTLPLSFRLLAPTEELPAVQTAHSMITAPPTFKPGRALLSLPSTRQSSAPRPRTKRPRVTELSENEQIIKDIITEVYGEDQIYLEHCTETYTNIFNDVEFFWTQIYFSESSGILGDGNSWNNSFSNWI